MPKEDMTTKRTISGPMILLVAGLLLAGCDYTVALVETPAVEIDRTVVGLWQRTVEDGRTERLLILPLDARRYLVSYPAGTPDALFAEACIWRGQDRVLVQLDWIGTGRAKLPETGRTFQYAAYEVSGDALAVRLVNPAVVSKEIDSSAELSRAVAENQHKPAFFRDPMTFVKEPTGVR